MAYMRAPTSALDTDPVQALKDELQQAAAYQKQGGLIPAARKYLLTTVSGPNVGLYNSGDYDRANTEYLNDLRRRESLAAQVVERRKTDPNFEPGNFEQSSGQLRPNTAASAPGVAAGTPSATGAPPGVTPIAPVYTPPPALAAGTPGSGATAAAAGQSNNLADILSLADVTNAKNLEAATAQYSGPNPYYAQTNAQIGKNIYEQSQGIVDTNYFNQLAAERGVGKGTNYRYADFAALTGRNRQQQQEAAISNLNSFNAGLPHPGLYDPSHMYTTSAQRESLDLAKLSNSQQYELNQAKLALEKGQLSIAEYNAVTGRIAAQNKAPGGGGQANQANTGDTNETRRTMAQILRNLNQNAPAAAAQPNPTKAIGSYYPNQGEQSDINWDYMYGGGQNPVDLQDKGYAFSSNAPYNYDPNQMSDEEYFYLSAGG